jgi:hypothetical protein
MVEKKRIKVGLFQSILLIIGVVMIATMIFGFIACKEINQSFAIVEYDEIGLAIFTKLILEIVGTFRIALGLMMWAIFHNFRNEQRDSKWVYHQLIDMKEDAITLEKKDAEADIDQIISWYVN